MLFYDGACGAAYIAAESDFPYRASALFVMDGLIEVWSRSQPDRCQAARRRCPGSTHCRLSLRISGTRTQASLSVNCLEVGQSKPWTH